MRDLLRPMLPMILVLAVPIIPFVLFGASIEQALSGWEKSSHSQLTMTLAVIALLSTDIFLPIPSSLVSTIAGQHLGVWLGTTVLWVGMNIGAIAGFALARTWGKPFVLWFTKEEELVKMKEWIGRYGVSVLVAGRGVPVVAEASVLFLGMHGLPWRTFLPPLLLSNFGLALAYAAFGQWTNGHGGLPVAVGFSIALPVLMAAGFRIWSKRT